MPGILEVTANNPSCFKIAFINYWEEYLNNNPNCFISWVEWNKKTNKIVSHRLLLGMIIASEWGPKLHQSICALHWLGCVCRMHYYQGILLNIGVIDHSVRFDYCDKVTDQAVLNFFTLVVCPAAERMYKIGIITKRQSELQNSLLTWHIVVCNIIS
ncbi:uncharacterized protein PHACADRAFT_189817 [Phanerochaete carnosa HHB-10118-sp]|uniref:Uncharacterized protein n=1 Tax=Phanerochaete carnosa (strain HHB-10118-sp) TaxID=650164 RepID=K5XCH9_PHACS|nr:uncharacterized protein PHACADRAFT_189817 [Phanerochaete carnosa HHB-10118-sp]EKM60697.1 hypothetical protein PHACADRAFT_189817 [Phanerochaete carnosa HHB-10118-sp]